MVKKTVLGVENLQTDEEYENLVKMFRSFPCSLLLTSALYPFFLI